MNDQSFLIRRFKDLPFIYAHSVEIMWWRAMAWVLCDLKNWILHGPLYYDVHVFPFWETALYCSSILSFLSFWNSYFPTLDFLNWLSNFFLYLLSSIAQFYIYIYKMFVCVLSALCRSFFDIIFHSFNWISNFFHILNVQDYIHILWLFL